MYQVHLTCVDTKRIGCCPTQSFTFQGDRAVMVSETSSLASRLPLRCVLLWRFLYFTSRRVHSSPVIQLHSLHHNICSRLKLWKEELSKNSKLSRADKKWEEDSNRIQKLCCDSSALLPYGVNLISFGVLYEVRGTKQETANYRTRRLPVFIFTNETLPHPWLARVCCIHIIQNFIPKCRDCTLNSATPSSFHFFPIH